MFDGSSGGSVSRGARDQSQSDRDKHFVGGNKEEALLVNLRGDWTVSCGLQEHPTAAQTVVHPIVKDARPE